MGLQQGKPSATLQRNVAHGLGPTVNRFGVHGPPGGLSTVAGFFVYARRPVEVLRLSLKTAATSYSWDIRPVKSALNSLRIDLAIQAARTTERLA